MRSEPEFGQLVAAAFTAIARPDCFAGALELVGCLGGSSSELAAVVERIELVADNPVEELACMDCSASRLLETKVEHSLNHKLAARHKLWLMVMEPNSKLCRS